MPTYDYRCEACGHTMEKWQSFKEDVIKECPECKQEEMVRLFGNPFLLIKGEPTTLIQQAEANSKRMGRNECEEREAKSKEILDKAKGRKSVEHNTPFWRNGSIPGTIKSDAPLTPAQVDVYKKDLTNLGCKVVDNAPPEKKKVKKDGE